ncbi:PAN domain-containing protein, putative [Eimeria mitis]|uniref:PAN domain-containing protein, putative n=1 Tax=Eimeria mitis TaxID=44415 RepID=U6JZZ3_9EIME|nr:PAN domain-containing protein, putative [Eimeria mitis]CDJ29078.1 PAN domain-containing protein, putative [Eimeria mitis]
MECAARAEPGQCWSFHAATKNCLLFTACSSLEDADGFVSGAPDAAAAEEGDKEEPEEDAEEDREEDGDPLEPLEPEVDGEGPLTDHVWRHIGDCCFLQQLSLVLQQQQQLQQLQQLQQQQQQQQQQASGSSNRGDSEHKLSPFCCSYI